MYNFIECINVEYTSSRSDVFSDISLDVKDCKNVYDSFDKFIQVQQMDGANKYQAEGHGYQVGHLSIFCRKF